jgi:hypothetical protein
MTGVMPFDSGDALSLGALFDSAGVGDLTFEFLLAGESSPLLGEVVYQIPGDFDLDGAVDAADLAIWRSAIGSSTEGDANADGVTDGADLLVWQRHFGATWSPTASIAQAAVPEPSAAALTLLAATFIASRRRI